MDSTRTMIREYRRCPEYADFFPTDQVSETGKFGNRTQKGSGQVRWFGQDLSRAPDWGKRKSSQQTDSQLMGRKRRAGDRFAPSSYEEDVVHQTEHWWDTPRKRALFGSDEPDSMTSGSVFPPGWRCSQCHLADAGVTVGDTGSFDELPVGTLRFSGAVG